jgi:hypothetical protein
MLLLIPNRACLIRPGLGVMFFASFLLLGPSLAHAEDDDWKYDIVHLKNGATMQGLVVKETPSEILFQHVVRKLGYPTRVFPRTLELEEIESVEPLEAMERERLGARIKALDQTGKGELLRMQSLELKPVP